MARSKAQGVISEVFLDDGLRVLDRESRWYSFRSGSGKGRKTFIKYWNDQMEVIASKSDAQKEEVV